MADAGKLKDLNIDTLRAALRGGGAMSKNQLARLTGLSFPTVSRMVDALVEAGELAERGMDRATGGRSARLYAANPLFQVVLTVRLETGTMRWVVEDLAGNRLRAGTCHSGQAALQTLDEVVDAVRQDYPQLGAIAMGLDGAVNQGAVTEAFGHDELKGLDLQRRLRERTGLPAAVENDMSAVAAGYASRCPGAGSPVVCIYQGKNWPGAGVVVDGEVWHGACGFAGELYYLPGLPGKDGATRNQKSALDMYTVLVCAYAALLNPSRVVLYQNSWIEGRMDEIRRRCAKNLPGHALPQIEMSDAFDTDYEQGLCALAKKLLQGAG